MLTTPFNDPIYPNTSDLSGDVATSRGSDPNASGDAGAAGLDPVWPAPVVPTPSGAETPNSVSGLPALPNRYAPSDQPPAPPSLEDRTPGTIDER